MKKKIYKISPGVQPRPKELKRAFQNITNAFLRYAKSTSVAANAAREEKKTAKNTSSE